MARATVFPRVALLVLPLLLAVTAAAGAATSRAGVRFASAPKRVVQGNWASASVSVRSGATCRLAVRYHNSARPVGIGTARSAGGRARWRWQVPMNAEAGLARLTAACGSAGSASRAFIVVGSVIPARIEVDKQGFSVRTRDYGGSSVSYGLVFRNTSPNQDALQVNVLVNFVMGDNTLLGSASTIVPSIGAGSSYALGSNLSFPGLAPVARLEVVVQIGARAPHATNRMPALANLRVEPSPYDPGWVGSVEGELINADPAWILQNAQLSAVVLDANGAVLGGGTGYAFATLPPGAREFIKMTSGFDAIPISKAASAVVSVQPSYRPPGS